LLISLFIASSLSACSFHPPSLSFCQNCLTACADEFFYSEQQLTTVEIAEEKKNVQNFVLQVSIIVRSFYENNPVNVSCFFKVMQI